MSGEPAHAQDHDDTHQANQVETQHTSSIIKIVGKHQCRGQGQGFTMVQGAECSTVSEVQWLQRFPGFPGSKFLVFCLSDSADCAELNVLICELGASQ